MGNLKTVLLVIAIVALTGGIIYLTIQLQNPTQPTGVIQTRADDDPTAPTQIPPATPTGVETGAIDPVVDLPLSSPTPEPTLIAYVSTDLTPTVAPTRTNILNNLFASPTSTASANPTITNLPKAGVFNMLPIFFVIAGGLVFLGFVF